MTKTTRILSMLMTLLLAVAVGCGGGTSTGSTPHIPDNPDNNNTNPNNDPVVGQSDFVSADGSNGQESQDNAEAGANDAPSADADGERGDEREAEEGDIYRVLSDGRILNLNAFRGLQIIDFTDVSNPEIEGRVQVTGYPVELYTVGDRAFVLMNNWRGYWRSVHDTRPETYEGGMVMVIDISDRANPRVTGQALVPGYIRTSRLTRGGGQEALYVVSQHWGERVNDRGVTESGAYTYVKSFSVSDEGAIEEASLIDLGGYVGDIQATGTRLMVARIDYNDRGPRSRVSLIDISSPDGTMVEGDEVLVEGYVFNKYNMDVYNNVLRVVSGSTWGNSRSNHVQTYDASDIHNLEPLDHDTFGDGENLFATLFMGNKAFFVTYRRVDPFHAFQIDDDGTITQRSEYIISGWNNFFRPVFGGDRLVGIGVNDEDGRTLAVSLYDTTDLSNPDPFINRAEVEANYSWSEANWDDRAFSVIEDAVEVEGPEGVTETGLVLLPFSGWDSETETSFAAVQIFTFSENTLTQRGLMHHGTPVRRSFRADERTTANLSEAEMSLFDTNNPDDPRELGRVELAPNYTGIVAFGDYGVRLKSQDYYYWWYRGQDDVIPTDKLEVIRLGGDPDLAESLATVEVLAGSDLQKVGDTLVATHLRYLPNTNPQRWEATIRVFDLSTPTNPREVSSLTTEQLRPSYGGYYYDGLVDDCFDCGGYWYGGSFTSNHVVGDAIVYSEMVPQQLLLGREHVCRTWPRYDERQYERCWDEDGPQACSYVTGGVTCRSLEDEPEHCTGAFYRCTQDGEGQTDCTEIEEGSVRTEEHCYDYDRYRYWQHYKLSVLDLSDPANPTLAEPLSLPANEEAAGLLADGDDLYVSYRIPVDVENDSRPFVRYYFRRLDLSNPAAPDLSGGINVPGNLLAVEDNGRTVVTQDYVWGEQVVEIAINKLTVIGERAMLDARRRFIDQQVHNVALDGRGHLLVSHRVAWRAYDQNNPEDNLQKLTVMDLQTESMPILSESDVDIWAQLQDARDGRALFSVPGGLLVMDLEDPAEPQAQAWFPTRGWPRQLVLHGDDIYFAAGRYGLYRFGLNDFNIF